MKVPIALYIVGALLAGWAIWNGIAYIEVGAVKYIIGRVLLLMFGISLILKAKNWPKVDIEETPCES